MNRKLSKFGLAGIIILILIVLSIPTYLWLIPKSHDRTLERFANELFSVQVPEKTHEVDRLSKVGQQIGNGDHCDYFAGLMVKTDLPKEQLEDHFRANYSGKSQIEFLWLAEENKYTTDNAFDPTIIHTLKDWVNNKSVIERSNVIVYVFEAAMTSALDLRCS